MTPILTQAQALDLFSRYRATGTPLIAYTTPDTPASQHAIAAQVEADDSMDFPGLAPSPILSWDIIRGLNFVNEQGKQAMAAMRAQPGMLMRPAQMLEAVAKVAERTVIFVHNAQLYWEGGGAEDRAQFLQGVLNLREPFKTNFRQLVLFYPGGPVPMALERDVVIIEEPLPGPDVLGERIQAILTKARENSPGIPDLTPALLDKATSALAGQSLYTAEQLTAPCIRESGLDLDTLRERARQQIRNTPGASVHAGTETFEGIGGNENFKTFCRLIRDGEEPPRVIVFLDEIEKQFSGYGTDTSGATGNQMGQVLQNMSDTGATGFILYGQPGVGKTEGLKALARELDTFVLRLELGAAKDKMVGSTEARTAALLRLVNSIGQGRAIWGASSNGLTTLPSELRSRFSLGTFFFDFPTEAERAAIWRIHERAWNLKPEQLAERPDDTNWTGREIAACCRNAYRLRLTLRRAAAYVVPVATSDVERCDQRRREAHGRYISSSYPGTYRHPGLVGDEAKAAVLTSTARAIASLGGRRES